MTQRTKYAGLVFLLLLYGQIGCSGSESIEANQGLDDVVINEFVATNTSDFVDEDGAASDWIELEIEATPMLCSMDGILPTMPVNLGSGAFLRFVLRRCLPGRLCIG